MGILKKHVAVIISIVIALCFVFEVVTCYYLHLGDPDVTVVACGCSVQKYSTDDTDYDTSVTNVMTNLVDDTPGNDDSYVVDVWPEFTVFGHGTCNPWLSDSACTACIYIAAKQLTQVSCPMSVGARLQLVDCRIRYEDYQFTE